MSVFARRRVLVHLLGSLHWLQWLVVGLAVLVTGSAWWVSRELVTERSATRFDRRANLLVERVVERMNLVEDALQAGVAAIAARGGDVDRNAWRAFARSLQLDRRNYGIEGVGVIRRVGADGLDALLARERPGHPGFAVHPDTGAAERFPIVYIEPEAPNREALGLDLTFEAKRLDGVLRANRTRRPQISAPVALVQDESHTPGLLFFAPWTRTDAWAAAVEDIEGAGFDGLVYAPIVFRNLMEGPLDKARREVWTAIGDDGERIFNEHDPNVPGHDPDPLFTRTVEVPMYGRVWRFDIRSNLAFRDAIETGQPAFVLAGGLLLDLLLIGLFVGTSRANRAMSRVADMNVALERKAGELAETNRDLERFACVVSHDLKTPLRGIGDLIWYLEEDLAPVLDGPDAPPEVAHNLARLNRQVQRMNDLIEGILAYSAAGTHAIRVEPVDVGAVLEKVADELKLAEGQLVPLGAMPVLETCRTRFEQVVGNIVGNAFKYHPSRPDARVTVRATPLGSSVRFSIADNGNGIDPRFHDRIFEIFQTLQTKADTESTGVGLSIVRKSVESVGGSVRVESSPGHGATFHVDWPRTIGTRALTRKTAARSPSTESARKAA